MYRTHQFIIPANFLAHQCASFAIALQITAHFQFECIKALGQILATQLTYTLIRIANPACRTTKSWISIQLFEINCNLDES